MRKTTPVVKKTNVKKKKSDKKSEGNWADKIFKELFQETLPVFLTDILHLPAGNFQATYLELQKTIEKRTDFLGKLFSDDFNKLIAHLEVQNRDEKNMVYRENIYSSLILDRFKGWDLLQYVFFIGKRRPNMPTSMNRSGTQFSFKLIWIKDIHYQTFLKTGKPELMLLAAISGYGDKNPKEVIIEVVNEVQKSTKTPEEFEKRMEQLHILTNIHNLHQIFESVMTNISQFIKVEKDPFYQKGVVFGKLEGKLEGSKLRSLEMAIDLVIKSHHDDAFISDISTISIENVAKIREMVTEFPSNFKEKILELLMK